MSANLPETKFETIVYEHQALIIRVCDIYCNSQPDKDDLFQEIVVNLWKGLSAFKNEAKLSTWIYRVSLNTAISKYKKAKKNQLLYTDQIPEATSGDADQETENSLRINALYKGIDKLKPVEKAIILLYLEERSYQEIADIVGLSKENISVKLVRIKKKLENYLKPLATFNR